MKFIFLMDPPETIIMDKDTSFILMLNAHNRGHEIYYLLDAGITMNNGQFSFAVDRVVPRQEFEQPFIVKESVVLTDKNVDAVFVRLDPPFDQRYLINTWLLDRLPKRIPVINTPSGIRTVNEKLWATQFTSLVPPTIVSARREDLLKFIQDERHVIAKPTDGHGGKSVFEIQHGGPNINVILETLTRNWAQEIILQRYLPEAGQGDKRILLLNGDPLGTMLRVHAQGEHRNNLFAGGKPKPCEMTDRDLEIVATLKPHLQKLGLYFVGIDIIGNYLIEVNVTSPTCLQEMNQIYDKSLEAHVIEFVEKLCSPSYSPLGKK